MASDGEMRYPYGYPRLRFFYYIVQLMRRKSISIKTFYTGVLVTRNRHNKDPVYILCIGANRFFSTLTLQNSIKS